MRQIGSCRNIKYLVGTVVTWVIAGVCAQGVFAATTDERQAPPRSVEMNAEPQAASSPEQATSAEPTPAWQTYLEEAQAFYVKENYKSALPLYEKVVHEVTSGANSAVDKVKCLRYLGDCYCRLNQPEKGLLQFQQIDKLLRPDEPRHKIANLNDEAVCHVLSGEYAKAESLCQASLKLAEESMKSEAGLDKKGGKAGLWPMALSRAHLAYIDYVQAKYQAAITGFDQAMSYLDASGITDHHAIAFRQKLAFATAGSYYHLKKFAEAKTQFKKVFDLDVVLFGKTNLQTGWAMLALSDVCGKLADKEESANWFRKAVFVFRKFNTERLYKQYEKQIEQSPVIKSDIALNAFGHKNAPLTDDGPKPLIADTSSLVCNHDPGSIYARPFTDAPGRVWLNPLVKQKGVILGIHGLSLQHDSYDALATRLADTGYCTVAFDVRGFGTYRQAFGAEQIDFDGCMQDLEMVASSLRQDNPDKPLFVMGESMGGAIAVQFAAQHPHLVDGLIASVPAGKRFNEKARALKVALRFLENKNKPFDIGSDVINQATHDPELKQSWSDNPGTRTVLSPLELVHYSQMLNRNITFAKQIKIPPVIIFQGVSDGLVKPHATYELFRAIGSKDKSLTMVGNAEHLIFEEGRFSGTVLRGLEAWMDSHLDTASKLPAGKTL